MRRCLPNAIAPIHRVMTIPAFLACALYALAYQLSAPLPPETLHPDTLGDAVRITPAAAVLTIGLMALPLVGAFIGMKAGVRLWRHVMQRRSR